MVLAALFAPALFALSTQNATQNPPAANSAVPGTINYVEGMATVNGQPLDRQSIGSAVEPGQVIATSQGRAEVLLAPGVFLRLGDNSAAQMISPDLTNTVVNINRGQAAVEVDQLFRENNIHIAENQVPVQLVKPGLYQFDADRGTVLVFKGEAAVARGNGKWVTIKEGHDLNVAEGVSASMKPAKFDAERQQSNSLYQWSSLRSEYLAEANSQLAPEYAAAGYAPGWYWDPWMWDYTFLGPYPFYSPFGWGFYPFGYAGFGYWGGYYGGGGYPHRILPMPHSGMAFHGGEMGGFHGGGHAGR